MLSLLHLTHAFTIYGSAVRIEMSYVAPILSTVIIKWIFYLQNNLAIMRCSVIINTRHMPQVLQL